MPTTKKGSWGLFGGTLILAVLYFFPIYFSAISAIKTNGEIMRDPIALPSSLYLDNFIYLWQKTKFAGALYNSAFLTIVSELLIVVIIPMAAYALERRKSKLADMVYLYFIAGMMIPFQAYMIPLFKELKMLGMFGEFSGPIIIYVSGSTAFGTLLVTSFIKGVPYEIEESASIDGCNSFMIYWRIVFPLLKPCIASLVILNGLGIWNDFLMPMLVLPSGKAKTINVEIYSFVDQFASRWDIVFAGVVCGIIPVLLVFIFLQKYFIKGITAGAAKG